MLKNTLILLVLLTLCTTFAMAKDGNDGSTEETARLVITDWKQVSKNKWQAFVGEGDDRSTLTLSLGTTQVRFEMKRKCFDSTTSETLTWFAQHETGDWKTCEGTVRKSAMPMVLEKRLKKLPERVQERIQLIKNLDGIKKKTHDRDGNPITKRTM